MKIILIKTSILIVVKNKIINVKILDYNLCMLK